MEFVGTNLIPLRHPRWLGPPTLSVLRTFLPLVFTEKHLSARTTNVSLLRQN